MVADWFRNKTWSKSIAEEFFARLSRCRSQRDQYLVIQALTLAKSFPDSALELVDTYFRSKKSDFEDVRALSARADAYRALGQTELALEAMKAILEVERKMPNHRTTMYVEYPYFVATRGIAREFENALSILDERHSDLMFPIDKFKWHAANSLIYHARQEESTSKTHAATALEAAQIKASGFRFHKDVGLVGEEHEHTIELLRGICA